MSSVSSDRPVLIVGGGLAGLTVAHRIHRKGIDFHLLEARSRLGGRILSVDGSGDISVDHPAVNRHSWFDVPWRDHVVLTGSETSASEPGYLADAVDAAESEAALISRMKDSLVVSSSGPLKRDSQKAAI